MNIIFNEVTKEFHLSNKNISYIFKVLKNGQLGHLYFGKTIRHREDFSSLYYEDLIGCITCPVENDVKFSLDYTKQEFPTFGGTNFTEGAFEIFLPNGSYVTEFKYKSHVIYKGKNKINNGEIPSTYSNDDVTTLEVTLYDDLIKTEITLFYSVFENSSIVARRAKISSDFEEALNIEKLMSCSLDLDGINYELLELTGNWINERNVEKTNVIKGKHSIYSLRGISSHQFNPFFALGKGKIDEFNGDTYGFSLVYSGNFLADVEATEYQLTRVSMGINPFKFKVILNKGESFETPEVLIGYSPKGLNGLSQNYHNLFKANLMKSFDNFKLPPIVINNWEATYFDFNEEKLLKLATKAKEAGIETFVLDDGWFLNRNNDKTSLGDWEVDKSKLPNGLDGLCSKINDMGLNFGLWIEPEMISVESDLYRKHSDWVVSTPNRQVSHGRNQYVLDFTRKEVVQYIYESISKVLSSCNITYVKWDMNRAITESFSTNLENQGLFYHNYILGVYELYEKLTTKFPNIMFEGCASGGGRFDPAMLYYSPQIWTSDNTDAVERLKIQWGTSIVYPLRAISNHVSAVPNHQVLRNTPLVTRGNTAYFGAFGYELDLNETKEDIELVKKQVEFYKKHRELIIDGDFYRIVSPFDNDRNMCVWQVVSKDKKKSIVGAYKVLAKANDFKKNIKLVGLDNNLEYKIEGYERTFFGDELLNIGVPITKVFTGANGFVLSENKDEIENSGIFGIGDYSSQIFVLESI